MKPLVEILLATYEGEQFLEAQLESLISQKFPDFRIIARDDCSSDGTWEILTRYQHIYPDCIYVHQATTEDPHGPAANFSALLGLSQAPYVMFCDQDDIWFMNKIQVFFEEMKKLEAVYGTGVPLLVHSDSKVVNEDLEVIHSSFFNYAGLAANFTSLNRLLVQNVITGFSTMINRELVIRAFPIPAEALMHDWWFALIGASVGHIKLVAESTALYRQHGSNTLGAKKWPNNIVALIATVLNSVFSKNVKEVFHGYSCQAELLLERVGDELHADEEELLKTFINLQYQGWVEKRIQLLRFRFLKKNFLKNVGLVLGI